MVLYGKNPLSSNKNRKPVLTFKNNNQDKGETNTILWVSVYTFVKINDLGDQNKAKETEGKGGEE